MLSYLRWKPTYRCIPNECIYGVYKAYFLWRFTAKGTLSRFPLVSEVYKHYRIINSHNCGSVIMVISEQRNQTSIPYHNSVHSEWYCALNHWSFISNIITGAWVIAYILLYWSSWLERLLHACLWLNSIYTKPVTCSKDLKVPFGVTRHIALRHPPVHPSRHLAPWCPIHHTQIKIRQICASG